MFHDCFEKKPVGTVEVTVVIVLYLDFHNFQIKIQRDGVSRDAVGFILSVT